jgi:hypothetical protein
LGKFRCAPLRAEREENALFEAERSEAEFAFLAERAIDSQKFSHSDRFLRHFLAPKSGKETSSRQFRNHIKMTLKQSFHGCILSA